MKKEYIAKNLNPQLLADYLVTTVIELKQNLNRCNNKSDDEHCQLIRDRTQKIVHTESKDNIDSENKKIRKIEMDMR